MKKLNYKIGKVLTSFLLFVIFILNSVGNLQAETRLGLYTENGVLKKDGYPFRGIGVNAFDLFYRSLKDTNDTSYVESLEKLSNAKVPFVRFMCTGFWPVDMELYFTNKPAYYSLLDNLVGAAEDKNVGLIPSLFWHYSCVPDLMGEPMDQLGNTNSATIAFIKQYTEEVVTRYKDSPAIWGWELGNEYSLAVDLPNASTHRPAVWPILGTPTNRTERDELSSGMMLVVFDEFVKTVQKFENPNPRITIASTSVPRSSAWHNTHETNWVKDTVEQYGEILARDNPDPYDMYNIHMYPNTNNSYSALATNINSLVKTTQEFAKKAKKPLLIGECGVSKKYGEPQPPVFNELINAIVKHKVPLAAIWVYDLSGQDDTHNITFENDRSYMLDIITNANAKMRSTNDGILFDDSFNITYGSGDVNYLFDVAGRQNGFAYPSEYTLLLQTGDSVTVNSTGPFSGKCKFDASVSGGSSFGLDYNFLESANFNIEFELTRYSNNWTGIGFGKNSITDAPPWGPSGMNFMCYPHGDYNIYDNGVHLANFNFTELSITSNNTLKIKFCIAQADFSGNGNAQVAMFINDRPYPLQTGTNKYVYTKVGGFTNNFIGFSSYSLTDIDNFKVSMAQENEFVTTNWTSDANSGIAGTKNYTHAICFGTNDNVVVNGVTFTGTGDAMSGNNWELKNAAGGTFSAVDCFSSWGFNPNISLEGRNLVRDLLYVWNQSGSLTLSGLIPDMEYALTLYSFGMGSQGLRQAYFATSDGMPITLLDQCEFGNNQGHRFSYRYTAPDSGVFSLSTTATNFNNAHWGWFAFSNEGIIPEPTGFLIFNILFLVYCFKKRNLSR